MSSASQSAASATAGKKSALFGLQAMKKYPELIPLVGILGFACAMGTTYVGYSLLTKSDVSINKSTGPRFERVDPNKSQKLLNINAKPQQIDELEALRREIGSYKS